MKTCLIYLFLLLSIHGFSQKLKYRIEHIGAEQGLSQGSVYSMYKDPEGHMWFGTLDGLNFWNGKTMKVYRPSRRDIYSIDGIDIKKIIGYRGNDLLIGTETCLNIYDSENDRFRKVFFRDSRGKITKNEVFPISVVGQELTLWLSGVGLLNFNFQTKKQQILVSENRFRTDYFSNINTTQSDLDNNVWLHSEEGLLKYDIKAKKLSYYFSNNNKNIIGEKVEIVKVLIEKENVWLGTFDGIVKFDTKTMQIKKWVDFGKNKHIGHVFDIDSDIQGNLWIGTERNGLLYFDSKTEVFEQISNKGSFSNFKLHNDEVSHVYIDNDGIIWANTDPYGIDKIQILPGNFGTYKLNLEGKLPESMQNFSIRSITKDGDYFWLGTQQSGVWRVNASDFSIKDGFCNLDRKLIPSNTVRFMLKDSKGKLWLGTSEGLAYFDGKKFVEVGGAQNKTTRKFIRVLEEFQSDLWIGTEDGIFKLEMSTNSMEEVPLFKNQRITLLKFLDKDKLLVGIYNEGLFEVNSIDRFKSFKISRLIANCIPTSILRQGSEVWVGTSSGLANLSLQTKKIRWIKREDGLPSEFVYAIESDQQQNLWLSTNKGIVKFDPKNLAEFHSFNINDGLQGFEFNGYASFKDTASGRLYFGGVNGLNYFNPNEIRVVGNNNLNVLSDDIIKLRPKQITYFSDLGGLYQKPNPEDAGFNSKFKPYRGLIPNFSYTPNQIWLKFTLKNKVDKSWFFELDNARLSQVEIWLYERNQLILYKKSGDKIDFSKFDVKSPNPIIKLEMIENQDYVMYIKGSSTRDVKFPMLIWEENELLGHLGTNKLIWGIYLGFIILISLYNIFLWITIKEFTYLYYSLYIILFGAFQLSLYGFGFQYVWSNHWFNEIAYIVFLFMSNVFLIFFTDSFLDLKKQYGKPWLIVKRVLLFWSVSNALLSLFYFRYWHNYFAIASGMMFSFTFVAIAIDYYLKKLVIIYYYGLATFFLVMASMIVGLQNLGLVEPLYQDKIIMAGSMLEIILFSVALGYKFRQNQLEKERQQMLRNQISGNLHDDLAASLSSLTMYTELSKRKLDLPQNELLERFERISFKSREILGKVREAVYELNPKNDQEEEWLERIVNFGKDIFESKNIEFRALIPEGFDSKSVVSEHRREIFLIFKEAMNNAAKYSEATTVIFEVKKMIGAKEFRLKDDGKGIETTRVDAGNGLSNIKERAKKMNAQLVINTKKGTEIILITK
jgi:ligand-binding sensor domain-containing protein/signal transduction histidine kinase